VPVQPIELSQIIMERRLTTILAADLVGYSRLMAADERGTVVRFRKVRAELVQPELAAAKARLIKTMGDGPLIEFPSPVAAVRASLAIQKSMVERERDQDKANRLQFRIGINLGDVIVDGDDDIFGGWRQCCCVIGKPCASRRHPHLTGNPRAVAR
jgi:adenylate cyclase